MGYNTTGNYGVIQAMLSGTAFENLVLNPSAGSVGIGSTVPSQLLDVAGGIRGTGRFWSGGPGNGGIWVDGGTNQFVGSYSASALGFYSSGWQMSVTSTGVGIGTTQPNTMLQVRTPSNSNFQITTPGHVTGASALVVTGPGTRDTPTPPRRPL
jgi:hypothetical protein